MYEKIKNLEPPRSKKHPPMPLSDRAAQFAPFAALTGFDDDINESARLTGERRELDDETAAYLDVCIQKICDSIGSRPAVDVTYFVPDAKKDGGEYITAAGNVRRIDETAGFMIFDDGLKIPLADICMIQFKKSL